MQLCDPAVLPSTPLMNLLRFMLATLVPRVAPSSLLIQFHAHCKRGRICQKLTSFVPGFPLEFLTDPPTLFSRPLGPPLIRFPDRPFAGSPRVCALSIRTGGTLAW